MQAIIHCHFEVTMLTQVDDRNSTYANMETIYVRAIGPRSAVLSHHFCTWHLDKKIK